MSGIDPKDGEIYTLKNRAQVEKILLSEEWSKPGKWPLEESDGRITLSLRSSEISDAVINDLTKAAASVGEKYLSGKGNDYVQLSIQRYPSGWCDIVIDPDLRNELIKQIKEGYKKDLEKANRAVESDVENPKPGNLPAKRRSAHRGHE